MYKCSDDHCALHLVAQVQEAKVVELMAVITAKEQEFAVVRRAVESRDEDLLTRDAVMASSTLTEVRRLRALLAEREAELKALRSPLR